MIKNNHIHQGPRSSRTPSVMGSLYVNSPIVLKDIYSSKINSSRAVPGTWHQPRKLLSPLPSQPLHLCRLILGIFQGKGRSPGLLVASLFQISPVLPYLRPAPQAVVTASLTNVGLVMCGLPPGGRLQEAKSCVASTHGQYFPFKIQHRCRIIILYTRKLCYFYPNKFNLKIHTFD